MEAKHETDASNSPETYSENHRGFTLTLESREATNRTGREYRAIAQAATRWESTWRLSWAAALFDVRALVDRYEDARETCERIRQRGELARPGEYAAGAVALVTRRPAVRS